MSRKFSGTVASGATETILIAMKQHENGFQLAVTGAGTMTVSTQEKGNAAFVPQTTMIAESLIFDLESVNQVKLVAAGANIPFVLRTRDDKVSSPDDNWDEFDRNVSR